ncbi:MAG: hypothetical protein Q4A46_03565 [Clostridia bacterium]|nr:hypothetical protein [Clostridia bacterium]
MSYIKADEVLPQNIIAIIQQYIDGESIYIPKWSAYLSKKRLFHRRWITTNSGKSL